MMWGEDTTRRMLDQIAAIISLILNPFLVLIATTLLVVGVYAKTLQEAILWSLISMVFASALPFLFILILVRLGKLSGLHLALKEQRIGPMFFSLGSAGGGTLLLHAIGAPKVLLVLGISYVVMRVVFTAITLKWKISFHSGVLAACITALAMTVSMKLLFLVVLLPPVAWARVYRKRHTLLQNVVAIVLAAVITVVVVQWG